MKKKRFTYHHFTALLFLLLIPFLANAFSVSSDSTISDIKPYMTREFTLSGPGILRVSTIAGDIEVERVPDSNKVRVELYVDWGYAFWSNSKNLDNYRVTMIQRGNEILASVEQKSKETDFFSDQIKFSYKIFVPQSMSTEMSTSAGDIYISGMQGSHMVKTGSGEVLAKNISGKLGAYSASGNIEITSSSGTLYAQTGAGNLSIQNSSGEIRLRTNAGDITGRRISGAMLAKTSSGDIRASFISVSTGISLNADYGDINLTIPGGNGYDLNLGGYSIELSDWETFSGSRNNTNIQGTLRGGGATINLITKSGDVSLDLKN